MAYDIKKERKDLYAPPAKRVTFIDVPAMPFLMIDGRGNPNGPIFVARTADLYALAYGVRFALKREGVEFTVGPLEALWTADDLADFVRGEKERWDWTLMIVQPPEVTPALVERVRAEVARKKGRPGVESVRLEEYHEGRAVQIMYVGAYADEGPTIARLHDVARAEGYGLTGRHHEIYLGDPRRTPPERLRTVLRQPVGDKSTTDDTEKRIKTHDASG